MKTWTGLDAPLGVNEGTVSLLDLVVHLGRTPRFGGWGDREYTVLSHSFLVALLWIRAGYPLNQLHHALLHDAHEAYTGDVPAPVKRAWRALAAGDSIAMLERRLDARIYEELGGHGHGRILVHPDSEVARRVKVCDLAAMAIESRLFAAPRTARAVDEHDVAHLQPDLRSDVLALVQTACPELESVAHVRGALGARPFRAPAPEPSGSPPPPGEEVGARASIPVAYASVDGKPVEIRGAPIATTTPGLPSFAGVSWFEDEGVLDDTTGKWLTRGFTASAPEVYAFDNSTGEYTFHPAIAGHTLLIASREAGWRLAAFRPDEGDLAAGAGAGDAHAAEDLQPRDAQPAAREDDYEKEAGHEVTQAATSTPSSGEPVASEDGCTSEGPGGGEPAAGSVTAESFAGNADPRGRATGPAAAAKELLERCGLDAPSDAEQVVAAAEASWSEPPNEIRNEGEEIRGDDVGWFWAKPGGAWHLWHERAPESWCNDEQKDDELATPVEHPPVGEAGDVCLACATARCPAGLRWDAARPPVEAEDDWRDEDVRAADEERAKQAGHEPTPAGEPVDIELDIYAVRVVDERGTDVKVIVPAGKPGALEEAHQIIESGRSPKGVCARCGTKQTRRKYTVDVEERHPAYRHVYAGKHVCWNCDQAMRAGAPTLLLDVAAACMAPDCSAPGTETGKGQKGARFCPIHAAQPLDIRREFATLWKAKQKKAADAAGVARVG